MSKYRIHKPEGAPDWFVPGIECEVSEDGKRWVKRVIIWYEDGQNYPFLAEDRHAWPFARPAEQWETVEGEDVLGFNSDGTIRIGKYGRTINDGIRFSYKINLQPDSYTICHHIARLQYPDGRAIDVTGGIDAIKHRTDWL